MKNEIYLTEQSLLELLQGKEIYDDGGDIVNVIHPPTTNELGIMKPNDDGYLVCPIKD